MEQVLSIQFQLSQEQEGFVKLIQPEPVDKNANFLTEPEAVELLKYFKGGASPPENHCTSDTPTKIIYAYSYPDDLNYDIISSKGEMARSFPRAVVKTETINCTLDNVLRTNCPIHSIISLNHEGIIYDINGDVLTSADVTFEVINAEVIFNKKIFSTVEIQYYTREEEIQVQYFLPLYIEGSTYDPFILAIWNNGNTSLKIQFEEGEEQASCFSEFGIAGLGGIGGIGGIEGIGGELIVCKAPPRYVDGEDETIKVDYCSGEELDG